MTSPLALITGRSFEEPQLVADELNAFMREVR